VLLFGTTGSGKTEVYLRAVRAALDADPQASPTAHREAETAKAHRG